MVPRIGCGWPRPLRGPLEPRPFQGQRRAPQGAWTLLMNSSSSGLSFSPKTEEI